MPPKPPKTRYFKGKAPIALSESESESESEQEDVKPQKQRIRQQQHVQDDGNVVAGGAGRIITDLKELRQKAGSGIKMELGGVQIGAKVGDGGVVEASSGEEETDEEDGKSAAGKAESEEGSSEYESSSEEESEEEIKKPAFRPVFVPKNARNMTAEKAAAEAEEAQKREEEMEAQRKLDSKELAGETIRRELAEKEAVEIIHEVDDTDGLDPDAEFDAWRARELSRLLREKKAQAERDAELEEIERRRAMPEEQRMAEDLEFARQTREKEKGEMGFLQKYYHKGAFHQDDELLKRDYAGATESSVDMSMLPKVMQVRDFGKASRSKYTHLADQDTSQGGWGAAIRKGPGGAQEGCWNCGGPHMRKDCTNNNINDPNLIGGMLIPGLSNAPGASGANTAALGSGSRSWGAGTDRAADQGGYRNPDRDESRAEPSRENDARAGSERRHRDDGRRRERDNGRRSHDRDGERGHGRDRDGDRYRDDRDRGGDRHRDDRDRGDRYRDGRDRDQDRRRDSPGRKRDRDERERERDERHDKRRREERDGKTHREGEREYRDRGDRDRGGRDKEKLRYD